MAHRPGSPCAFAQLGAPNTRVFIDTSSLLEATITPFYRDHLTPLLKRHNLQLIVATRVLDELRRQQRRLKRPVERAKHLLGKLQKRGLLDLKGDPNDAFADNVFLSVFTRLRLKYRLVLITQDRALAEDILALNSAGSVHRIIGIHALRIDANGAPEPWALGRSAGRVRANAQPKRRQAASAPRPFCQARAVVSTDDTRPLRRHHIPGEGDEVFDNTGRSYTLGACVGSGGEGSVFRIGSGLVCKVYDANTITQRSVDKLRLMCSRELHAPGVCWPRFLAHNNRGEVVGYVMEAASGDELQTSVFVPPVLRQRFPTWNRSNLVRLALTIVKRIDKLHALGVLVGDINPRNILVRSDTEVFLVDCDSAQVEGYPCPVGMPAFLAPELQNIKLRTTLRDMRAEQFAVATLIFMILMPGKPPFSHQGGTHTADNITKQHFPYAVGKRGYDQAPVGPWKFMWSHMPRYFKDALFGVFADDKRLSTDAWIKLLERYANDLRCGFVSDALFPRRLKDLSRKQAESQGMTWTICPTCEHGFGANGHWQQQCHTCLHHDKAVKHLQQLRDAHQQRRAARLRAQN